MPYQMIIPTTNQTLTYKTKDLLYQALERENAKARHEGKELELVVEESNKKGMILASETVLLPFDGVADALFLQKKAQTETKGSLRKRLKRSKRPKPSSREQGEKQPFSKKRSRIQRVARGVGLFLLALLLMCSLGLNWLVHERLRQQETTLADLRQVQVTTPKVDAFCRLFLPHYFAGEEQLQPFLAPKLKLSSHEGQVQSLILEDLSYQKQTYQVVYLLALKEGDATKLYRLQVALKHKPQSLYGFVVVQEPQLSPYPLG